MRPAMNVQGWDYTDPANRINLINHFSGTERACLIHALEGGGKAFGLTLLELVKEHLGSAWNIPSWFYLTPEEQRTVLAGGSIPKITPRNRGDSFHSLFCRSSDYHEDWGDSRAGRATSFRVNLSSIAKRLRENGRSEPNEPVVIQEYCFGVGLVIDIGYSPVVGAVVARVSRGRTVEGCPPTSPTWDPEGSTAVWRLDTLELVSEVGIWGKVSDRNGNRSWSTLLGELAAALQKCHIDFGVQLELIGGSEGGPLQLLQLRPSPGLVRNHDSIEPVPVPASKAVWTTGRVSGAIRAIELSVGRTEQPGFKNRFPKNMAGRAVLWWYPPEKYEPEEELLQVAVAGAVVQIGYSLRTNTIHGVPNGELFTRSKDLLWHQALNRSTFFTVSHQMLWEMDLLLSSNPDATFAFVSDGLVGKIYAL